jgi:hypothetical protein
MNNCTIQAAVTKAQPQIDVLVDTFIKSGWIYLHQDFDAKQSRHAFELTHLLHPRLSNDHLDTDLLGRYQVEDAEYDEPGRRFLFVPSIIKAAQALHIHLPKHSIDTIIESLTAIVAIHETVHWIMHAFTSPSGNRIGKEGPFDNSSLYYDEGLAQYFTHKIIENDALKLEVFDELCKHQTDPYLVFRDCEKYEMVKVLAQLTDPVVLRSQSWELLNECLAEPDKDLAIKNYIHRSQRDDTYDRFRMVLRIHRPDLSDGPHNSGKYRGRIIAKAFGM